MANPLMSLIRGFPGKPSHPPLTDVAIGAYTMGVAMLVAGAFGLEEEQMAHGALLAIGGGLAVSLPTALTGLLDWLRIEKGTPRRTIATVHLIAMLLATAAFAVTFLTHLDGYDDGTVEGYLAVLGLIAEGLLTAGGYLGGTLVFVYGVRVLGRRDTPLADALVPWRGSENESVGAAAFPGAAASIGHPPAALGERRGRRSRESDSPQLRAALQDLAGARQLNSGAKSPKARAAIILRPGWACLSEAPGRPPRLHAGR